MTYFVSLLSVPLATIVCYFAHFLKTAAFKDAFDNQRPRDYVSMSSNLEEGQREYAMRLNGAHQNMIETLGIYSSGIVAGIVTNVNAFHLNTLAVLYILFRVIYLVVYAAPQVKGGYLRTAVFAVCMTIIMTIWMEAIISSL